MELFLYFIIFLFGLAIGSFLNVVIYRLETEESIATSRSHCMRCNHVLAWYDLVPLLSFLVLGGKCRYCHKPISWQYPLVELTTGILFILLFRSAIGDQQPAISNAVYFMYLLIINCLLLVIFVYDFKFYLIPDKTVLALVLASGIWYLVSGIFFNLYTKNDIINTVLAAFASGGFFLLLVLLSKGKGMGMGDVKLGFALGLILGFSNTVVALFFAFILGTVVGVFLIASGEKGLKSKVPFGPFLVAGTIIGLFWGGEIVKWYSGYLYR